jgi:hypothetical protein
VVQFELASRIASCRTGGWREDPADGDEDHGLLRVARPRGFAKGVVQFELASSFLVAEPGAGAKTRLTEMKTTASSGWHVPEALRRAW